MPSALLTHLRIEDVFGRFISAHVDSPGWNVSEQHGAESSVQAAHAILDPYDPCGAGQAFVHCARWASIRPGAKRALRLQAGLDDIERARYNARGNSSRSSAQCIDGAIGEFGDPDGESGNGRAPRTVRV